MVVLTDVYNNVDGKEQELEVRLINKLLTFTLSVVSF